MDNKPSLLGQKFEKIQGANFFPKFDDSTHSALGLAICLSLKGRIQRLAWRFIKDIKKELTHASHTAHISDT